MPKSRKTKAKYKDFQKVKLKVGKTLPKADNVTNTNFKSRGIHIKEQLKSSAASGVTTTRRKQDIQDLLAHCHHHNISMRHDAVTGLREIITENPTMLQSHLAPLLERVPDLCIDKDGAVRHATHRFFKAALPHIPATRIAPFFPILSAHLCCAMTHIDDEIQMDSLLLFDLYMEHYPQLVVTSHNDLLTNFIEQISRKSSSSSSGGEQKGAGGGRALLVNPNSKMSSRKGRVQVLARLHRFLKAVIDQRDPVSSEVVSRSNSTFTYSHETAAYHQPIGTCWSRADRMHKLNDKIKSAAASGSDILANGQKLRASLDVLLPLMLQCWVEVGPAQLSTDLPGNVMSRDAMSTLANILKVLHLLLKCVEVYDKDADNTIMKDVRGAHLDDFVQYYLPFFPYSMHEAPVSSKKKAPKSEPTIPVLSLNLLVCEVMSYFASPSADSAPSWLEKLTDFVGQSARQPLDHEQLQSLLRFVGKLLEFDLDLDKQEELMGFVCALFSATRGQSLSRNTVFLLHFIADQIMAPKKSHFFGMKCVKKWLAKIPAVLVQSTRENNNLTRRVIDISRQLAPLRQEPFLGALAGENCLKLIANLVRLSPDLQGALVDVMYWVPCWDQVALQTLAGALRTGSPQPAHAHKLLLALVYRYERQRASGDENLIFDHADFFNFLLAVVVGYRKQDLERTESNSIPAGCSFLTNWGARVRYIEVISSVLPQLPNTSQILELLETAVRIMLEQYRIPLDTIYAFLVVLTRLHKSSGEIIPFSSSPVLVTLVRAALREVTSPEPEPLEDMGSPTSVNAGPAPAAVSWQVARDATLDACMKLLAASSDTLSAFVTELLISMQKNTEKTEVSRHVLILKRLYRDTTLRPAIAHRVHHIRTVTDQLQEENPDLQTLTWWSDLKYEVSLMQPK